MSYNTHDNTRYNVIQYTCQTKFQTNKHPLTIS